jgi:cyclase
MANESRMPIAYGGGIKSIDEIDALIKSGIEKIICSSLFFQDLSVLQNAIGKFGSQSISVCLDYKLIGSNYSFYINNGKKRINDSLETVVTKIKKIKCGEVIFNSIDNDGTMSGMDQYSMKFLPSIIDEIPTTFIGGLSSYNELKGILRKFNMSGVAAGSLFVFKGKHFAVLINYDNFLKNE